MIKTVIVRLAGGLGNQLFQLAALMKAGEIIGPGIPRLIIDTRSLGTYRQARELSIGFALKYFPEISINSDGLIERSLVSSRIAKVFEFRCANVAMCSTANGIQKYVNSRCAFVLLDGYFQDKRILFNELERKRLHNALRLDYSDMLNRCKGDQQATAIHIRRGDYVSNNSAAKIFRSLPLDYYRKALTMVPHTTLTFVFCDDAKISEKFATEIGGIDVRSLGLSLTEEFVLMSNCDNIIAANSTFSWWAAFLSIDLNRVVICPRNWYRDSRRNGAESLLISEFSYFDNCE
jgi:hypothetical protein